MAYFLKKSTLNGRTYISICESFYSHEKKGTVHKTYKSLGSVETCIENGIEDPIAHYKKEVDRLNNERKKEVTPKISDTPPTLKLGYFPLKSVMDSLKAEPVVNLLGNHEGFQFDLFQLVSSLIYARAVNPCSKLRTFHEVLPNLYHTPDYSYDQLLSGLSYLGSNYEKIVELFTSQVSDIYGIDTRTTYFDCTNFYFEIDREDDFRRKGPSKENRRDPIIGLGLLLDSNLIPVSMKMYPGNQSEKPILRDTINRMKQQSDIEGRTVHVADKGLNCAQNIEAAIVNGDGYLFSKSVKTLPETEKTWVLLESGYVNITNANGDLLYKYKSCVDEFPYKMEINGKIKEITVQEKRLVTYNPSLAKKKKCEIRKMEQKAESLTLSGAARTEYGEVSKYVNFKGNDGKKAKTEMNREAVEKDLQLAGYNLLVTSEVKMSDQDIYETYHNLWRIEESFKIMKSDLDARPVFLQKEDTIKGHFVICYLTVLLGRLFQFKVLENKYSTNDIYEFIKTFQVAKTGDKYLNISRNTAFLEEMEELTGLPLRNLYLSETKLRTIMNYKFR